MAARYTEQLVLLEEPEVAARVRELVARHGVSQAEVLRLIVREGLPGAAKRLAQWADERAALLAQ